MQLLKIPLALAVLFNLTMAYWCFGVGITPEQIYQDHINWEMALGTWEKLPEVNPLSESNRSRSDQGFRTLMTLRKDGTCRIFNAENQTGIDGEWRHENHCMFITLRGTTKLEFFVYGIKNDFMVTRSPLKSFVNQLWSRVK